MDSQFKNEFRCKLLGFDYVVKLYIPKRQLSLFFYDFFFLLASSFQGNSEIVYFIESKTPLILRTVILCTSTLSVTP